MHPESPLPSADSRVTRLVVRLVAAWFLVVIPFRVVAVGHRPADDARRHAAKVVADKPWGEILLLREEIVVDPHPGWHAALGALHRMGVKTPTGLLVASVVGLGAVALLAPLLVWKGRAEAWLLALLVAALAEWGFFYRLMIGRPLVISLAVLFVIAFVWHRFENDERWPWRLWAGVALLLAVAVWMHGNWYLWCLPFACFFAARRRRAARRLSAALAVGTAAGALATGRPIAFLSQTLIHPWRALASGLPREAMVSEFQPSDAALPMVAVLLATIAWRRWRGREIAPVLRDPIFLLAVGGWVLGLFVVRFWLDWGMPAGVVWLTGELHDGLERIGLGGRPRLLAAAAAGAILGLVVTADSGRRWSHGETAAFLSAERPEHRPWLPDAGGILYSNDMRVFYNTFFRNPRAPWRYAVGFEPALMPPADFAIYREIQRRRASDASLAPWVRKMRPEDRLVVVREGDSPPAIAALDWHSPYREMWIGRRPSDEEERSAAPQAR